MTSKRPGLRRLSLSARLNTITLSVLVDTAGTGVLAAIPTRTPSASSLKSGDRGLRRASLVGSFLHTITQSSSISAGRALDLLEPL